MDFYCETLPITALAVKSASNSEGPETVWQMKDNWILLWNFLNSVLYSTIKALNAYMLDDEHK